MKSYVCLILLSLIALPVYSQSVSKKHRVGDIMPLPKIYSKIDGKFRFNDGFLVSMEAKKSPRLKRYLERVIKRLEGRVVRKLDASKKQTVPNFSIETKNTETKYPKLGMDESYSLRISKNQIELKADNGYGAMRGLETLVQLLSSDSEGFYFPFTTISDSPRFPWRGLLIDVARHYQPVHVLKRNLDGLAAVKMNVFHWHLTEDQGFRVESKRLPRLHTYGSDGLYYTQEEIKEVVEYAADRGIRVMPEFDIPGHATAWLVGHPEIGSAPGPYTIERDPGIFDPTLNPIKDETYELLDTFLTEMAPLFPDEYMHIGGDENEGKHWDANAEIQAFMKANNIKDNHELQTYFNKRVLKILQRNKKIMMGWDEIFQPNLPKEVVIHSWRGQKALAESAQKGFTGVLSNGYYIDLMQPAREHYLVDPIPAESPLSKEEKKRVLGGEATMWGEWVSPETIDSRIWMRTAAIAERLWSVREVRDVDDMYRRLDILSPQLEDLGLKHKTIRAVLLRRLAPGHDINPLLDLLEVIEPVKQYRRYQIRKQTMLDPLTGLIDAAGSDARYARKFNDAVDKYIESDFKDAKSRELIEKHTKKWLSLRKELEPIFENSGGLQEASDVLPGLERMHYVMSQAFKAFDDKDLKRLEELKGILKKHRTSKAAVEFAVAYGIEKYIGETEKNLKNGK